MAQNLTYLLLHAQIALNGRPRHESLHRSCGTGREAGGKIDFVHYDI